MSDLLDDFREHDDTTGVDDVPTLMYGFVDEFVREYLRHMYTRPRWSRKRPVSVGGRLVAAPRSGRPPRGPVASMGAPSPGSRYRCEHLVA